MREVRETINWKRLDERVRVAKRGDRVFMLKLVNCGSLSMGEAVVLYTKLRHESKFTSTGFKFCIKNDMSDLVRSSHKQKLWTKDNKEDGVIDWGAILKEANSLIEELY